MKIGKKITFYTSLSIILLVVFLILTNTLFSYKFYVKTRKLELDNVVEEVVRSKYDHEVIKKLESTLDITIETDKIPKNREQRMMQRMLRENNEKHAKFDVMRKNVRIVDRDLFITFIYKVDEDFVRIKVSKISVIRTIKSTNKFILFIGLFIGTIGVLLSILLSKIISKPILRLNDVVSKIANLDFSEKIEIKGKDEISELSRNVNFLNDKLNQTLEDLKNIYVIEKNENRKREEFIAALTHEIKTPITVINTYLEYMKTQNITDDEKKQFTDIIISEGNDLSKILDRLIQYVKKEENIENIEKSVFDYNKLVENRIKKFQLDITEKNININTHIEEGIFIDADYDKMTYVLDNILSNAISYTEQNGEINISVTNNENDKIITEIYNSGKKIKEENINRIWESFFKEDESRTKKYGGIGLGLSFVKKILKMHKSEFGAKNVENGVVFWFTNDRK